MHCDAIFRKSSPKRVKLTAGWGKLHNDKRHSWQSSSIDVYRVFNLKVDRQLSRQYFTSDAIYNGIVGMTLYYYMCRSWQDCCRRGKNRSWPSVSVESVDSECWCLNNAIFYTFIMRLTFKNRASYI